MRKKLALAVLCAGVFSVSAEDYQFYVSGYPAQNLSWQAESPATSLETATRRSEAAPKPLEARFRTRSESNRIPLRTDKFQGMIIILC